MVPVLLIPQVVLSNAIVALDGIKAQDAAGAPIVSLAGAYWSDLGMVIVLGLAFLASTVFGLKLKDRRR
jgi:hypothetical protein